MHPTDSTPGVINIRYKTWLSVLYIVAGSLLIVFGLIVLLSDGLPIWLVLGPVFLTWGIVSLSKPYMAYDTGRGTLDLYGPFGNRVRTYGPHKGERIAYDGANLVRLRQDGTQKKVSTAGTRSEDVQRLQQTLWSLQQQPPAGRA